MAIASVIRTVFMPTTPQEQERNGDLADFPAVTVQIRASFEQRFSGPDRDSSWNFPGMNTSHRLCGQIAVHQQQWTN
jgi:hypothetical protein